MAVFSSGWRRVIATIMRAEIDVIMQSTFRDYSKVTEPKIAGVLYHVSTPAFLEKIRLFMGAHSVAFAHISGRSDRNLLENLARSLATE